MQVKKHDLVILGAGSWGTALALHLARNGRRVCLWSKDAEQVRKMSQDSENVDYLPGCSFPEGITCQADLPAALACSKDWLIAIPSSPFFDFLELIKPHAPRDIRIAWVTKGLDPETNRPLDERVSKIFPGRPLAVLSGPSLAAEVAIGLPAAVVVAGTDEQFNKDLQAIFHAPNFRVYQNDDMKGVELCGALKNVLAIGVGLSDGLKLGSNARAALMTRGLVEMRRLCEALGGRPETLVGLAGLGDLLLTSTDDRSRNRRFGLALGRGLSAEQALAEIGQAVEGYVNCKYAYFLAKQLGVKAPITEQVYQVAYEGQSVANAAAILMDRDPAYEFSDKR
jgi:glycerol-3-phosphate dehydrogenase (NAD(P)+)